MSLPIPPPYEPFLDRGTGRVSLVWYQYLANVGRPDVGQVRYLFRSFAYDSTNATVGTIPANAMPLETYVSVNSTFASANVIVGTSVDSAAAVSTADIGGGKTTGFYVVDRYMGTRSTAAVPLYVQTNSTLASAGQMDVWQAYLPST